MNRKARLRLQNLRAYAIGSHRWLGNLLGACEFPAIASLFAAVRFLLSAAVRLRFPLRKPPPFPLSKTGRHDGRHAQHPLAAPPPAATTIPR